MFIPSVYPTAPFMMILGMPYWGSCTTTQKPRKSWRFGLFYRDYVWGNLIVVILTGLMLRGTMSSATSTRAR